MNQTNFHSFLPALKKLGEASTIIMGIISLGLCYALYDLGIGFCTNTAFFGDSLLRNVGIASIIGIPVAMISIEYGRKKSIHYSLQVLVRFIAAYFLLSYAVNQLLDITYPESHALLEQKIRSLSNQQFVYAFFGHTYIYQAFLSWTMVITALFLFFKKTVPIGLLLLTGITLNAIMITRAYDICRQEEALIFGFISIFMWLPYGKNAIKVLFLNRPSASISFPSLGRSKHTYNAFTILKVLTILGLLTFYFHKSQRYLRYYRANAGNPLVGVWKVESIQFNEQGFSNKELDQLASFERFYLDGMRYGAVGTQDSISYFEYMVDTTFHQLEFWNFHNFDEVDLKGKYEQIDNDTLLYVGKNQKKKLRMTLVVDHDYPKLR